MAIPFTDDEPLFKTRKGMPYQLSPNEIDLQSDSVEIIEWEGHLHKQTDYIKRWSCKFFTLRGNTITYYKNKIHAAKRHHPRGSGNVIGVNTGAPPQGVGGIKLQSNKLGFTILLEGGNQLIVAASSWTERQMWLHVLGTCSKHSKEYRMANITDRAVTLMKCESEAAILDEALQENTVKLKISESQSTFRTFEAQFSLLLTTLVSSDVFSIALPQFLSYFSKEVLFISDFLGSYGLELEYHGREGIMHLIMDLNAIVVKDVEDEEESKITPTTNGVIIHRQMVLQSGYDTDLTVAIPVECHLHLSAAGRIDRFYMRNSKRSVSYLQTRNSRHIKKPRFAPSYTTKRALALCFHDFEVLSVLGRGGYGTVVLVKKRSDQELFAMKILDKNFCLTSAMKERTILANLNHPFLVSLKFAFQSSQKLYLGMKFFPGGSLYHQMNLPSKPSSKIDIKLARFYAAEILLALSYLHNLGIVYRDLKPDNIMLDSDGHICMVDFGNSKQLKDCLARTVTGTPAYIAPEQIMQQNPSYGVAADWWSFGVVLYEMLFGKTPFYHPNLTKMYQNIQEKEVSYFMFPSLDLDAKDLLSKLLVRDPDKRLGSKAGAKEIRNHPFFASIDWEALLRKEVPAPYAPKSDTVLANVHQNYINMDTKLSKLDGSLDRQIEEHSLLVDFTFSLENRTPACDDSYVLANLISYEQREKRVKV